MYLYSFFSIYHLLCFQSLNLSRQYCIHHFQYVNWSLMFFKFRNFVNIVFTAQVQITTVLLSVFTGKITVVLLSSVWLYYVLLYGGPFWKQSICVSRHTMLICSVLLKAYHAYFSVLFLLFMILMSKTSSLCG